MRRWQENASPTTFTVEAAAARTCGSAATAASGPGDRGGPLLVQVGEDLGEASRVQQLAEGGEDLVRGARHDAVHGGQHAGVAGLLRERERQVPAHENPAEQPDRRDHGDRADDRAARPSRRGGPAAR